MKRLAVALGVGAVVFGTVWALAATMDVSGATAATGTGDVAKCGDVTGSTFILEGQSDTLSGPDLFGPVGTFGVADITEFKAVNIETVADCDHINAFIEVRDGSGSPIASGNCEVNLEDGLGFDEASASDNVPGCTAFVGTDTVANDDLPDVAPAVQLVVTMT
jgi:hypothetical protein